MTLILGYWDIRGLAHAIRLLLEYTDSSYEEKKYTMGDAPDYDRSQWLSEKFKLGLDFPNLPYLIDGAHKLTQSNAILRYIARKHNMCGETEEEKIRVDVLENQTRDTADDLASLCYSSDFEKLKPGYLKEIPEKMKPFSEFLGKRPWFAGDKLTYVDFLAYDVLDLYRIFDPKCLDEFPNLKDFLSRFELTYLIDGAHKLTQSNAILRYIARKHNMCGETEEEKIRMARICYSPDFEKLKPGYLKEIPEKMKPFSEFLGKRPWFAGDKLTYVDFLAYDVLDLYRIFDPKCLDGFPNLRDFLSRFEGLKKIAAYMRSSRFLPGPLFLKVAMWGNK
uniref:Glutathione S-transferase n=1 Tax=Sus scrofa TaxID=9823 RepID=A0A5G2Q9Q5_PIG